MSNLRQLVNFSDTFWSAKIKANTKISVYLVISISLVTYCFPSSIIPNNRGLHGLPKQKFLAVAVSRFKHISVSCVSHFIHLVVLHFHYTLILKWCKKCDKGQYSFPCFRSFRCQNLWLTIYCTNTCVTNCRVVCVSTKIACHSSIISNKLCVTKYHFFF